jgi:menaquinone-dependent protoporphyrinogen oxidase
MTVLVAVASKHRSTFQIGQAIAAELAERGIPSDVRDPVDVPDVGQYQAVVIGSAVYAGNWMAQARELIDRCEVELRERPVWLFSSGPLGDPPLPAGDPAGVAALIERVRPRGHRVFPGRLERDELGFGEKLIIKAVRAPSGDFRDWAAIADWAGEIAAELGAGSPSAPQPTPV